VLINLLLEQPIVFLMLAAALVISISIHEFAHAFTADKLGDNTARLLGRVTLDPRAHLDPLGTALLLIAGFGWGRPVPFNPINLGNPKRDSALIAFAGPLSNFILATFLAGALYFIGENSLLGSFIYLTVFYNIVLGVFNLLPVHPLDGFKVVAGLLPPALYMQWMQMQRYGIYILIFLIFFNVTDIVIMPIINIITTLLGL
jgi:Zn-dependent protease